MFEVWNVAGAKCRREVAGVTAVIQRYYESRLSYVRPILESLAAQTVRPERVILWNNFPHEPPPPGNPIAWFRLSPELSGLTTPYPFEIHRIYSSKNTLMGRWAAVLLAETPYVYIQDDDLVMGPETVERLLEASEKHFGALVGPFGMKFGPDPEKPYTSGKRVHDGPVDVILGRCFLASRSNLLRRLSLLGDRIPFGRNDDIFASTAVGTVNYVVPGIGFANLDEKGVGLSHEPAHMDERNAAARAVLEFTR